MSRLRLESNDGGTVDVVPVKIVPSKKLYERIEPARGVSYLDLPLKLE